MDGMDAMVDALKKGIDKNSTDAPQMSIDPKTQAVSVVGDPNKIKNEAQPYKLVFAYPEDEITEEDKVKMTKSDIADNEYEATITYEGKRVRPINRTKIAMYVGQIFNDMGLFSEDGSYDSDTMTRQSAKVFLNHIEDLAEMAKMVLDVPESQIKYIRDDCLIDFFVTMLQNEPNVIKEAASFLDASSRQRLAKMAAQVLATNQQPSTPQS